MFLKYPKEKRTCAGFIIVLNEGYINMVVSNHFHSVKNFLFSSAKPRDFDGMLGTGLSVSMYTMKLQSISAVLTLLNLKNFLHFL